MGEAITKPFARINGIKFDMTESIALDFQTSALEFFHDSFHTRAFRDEDIDIVDLVHQIM